MKVAYSVIRKNLVCVKLFRVSNLVCWISDPSGSNYNENTFMMIPLMFGYKQKKKKKK